MKTRKEKIQDSSAPFALLVLFLVFTYISFNSECSNLVRIWIICADIFLLFLTICSFNAKNPPSTLELFLRNYNIYDEFISEMNDQGFTNMETWFKDFGETENSLMQFNWSRTKRGRKYWEKMNKRYINFTNFKYYEDDQNE